MFTTYDSFAQINVPMGHYNHPHINTRNNEAYRFWLRALSERAKSVFKFENLPESWQGNVSEFLEECLIRYGYVYVGDNNTHGIFFQPAALKGLSFYYQPTAVTYYDRTLKTSVNADLGERSRLLKLTPDYRGIYDVIEYYAEKLALCDCSINTALVNSKLAYMLFAKNKAAAEAYKKAIDRIDSGEPAVVLDKLVQDDVVSKESAIELVKLFTSSDYVTDKLIQDHVNILHDFDTEIGIPTLPYEKKERMVTAEATSKNIEAIARCTVWLDSLNASLDVINREFGLNIIASLRWNDELTEVREEVVEDETNADIIRP